MRKNFFLVRRIQEGYYPVDYTSDFEIVLESNLKSTDIILKEISGDLIPPSLKDVPCEEIILFLNALITTNIIFVDVREKLHNLADQSCWLSLEELGIKKNIIVTLNKYNSSLNKDFKEKYNLCDEINLLGELASYKREQISGIPGIGKKTIELFDKLILKNGLYWDFKMELIKKLGKYK